MHSNHSSQYLSEFVKSSSKIKHSISMGRIGNSLDNREVEYFFWWLKGEYLKRLKTWKMSFEEIHKHIKWYIEWYNTKKITLKNASKCQRLCNLNCRIYLSTFMSTLWKMNIKQ